MRKNLIFSVVFSILCIAKVANANCVAHEFVTDYCYFGLASSLPNSAISITPRQFGYEASTIVEIKVRETVGLAVTCENGAQPLQTFVRVRKDERSIISEERYKSEDAIADVKTEYNRLRTRLSNYLCSN